jgi:hypothetical protein
MIELKEYKEDGTATLPLYAAQAIAYNPFVSIEDLTYLTRKGVAILLVIYSNGHEVGCAAVEYLYNAKGAKHLNIVGIGCESGTYRERIEILSGLEKFAESNGCTRIFADGREGWIKLAQELGYSTLKHVVFWKNLEG